VPDGTPRGYHFTGTAQQKRQRSKGQILKADPDTVPPQFATAQVGFEPTEANQSGRRLYGARKKWPAGGEKLVLHRI
jgi:hypothetical protein